MTHTKAYINILWLNKNDIIIPKEKYSRGNYKIKAYKYHKEIEEVYIGGFTRKKFKVCNLRNILCLFKKSKINKNLLKFLRNNKVLKETEIEKLETLMELVS